MPVADILPFFLAWIRNPLRVAAVAPSGAAVATLMTEEITAATGPIIELGPGTGPFTYALLDRGVREQDLTLIEYDPDFLRLLRVRFPQARVLWMDAAWLDKYKLYENATIGAVISGLGLLTMSPHKITAILSGAFGYLRPDGAFYQITYGPRCPIADSILEPRIFLAATSLGTLTWNMPFLSLGYALRGSSHDPVSIGFWVAAVLVAAELAILFGLRFRKRPVTGPPHAPTHERNCDI
jgi:phosphatidylethanolamine/phosphatidyl-N-methylethanolamine N-methyltransferase